MLKPQKISKATLWQVVFLLLPTHVCPYAWYWYCGSQVDVIYNNCYLSQNVISCFLSVVVIMHPSLSWGRQFDPGRKQIVNFNPRYGMVDSSNPCYWEASKSLELPVLEFSWKLGASQPTQSPCYPQFWPESQHKLNQLSHVRWPSSRFSFLIFYLGKLFQPQLPYCTIVWTCKNTIVSATINCIINLMPKRIYFAPGWAWTTNPSVNSQMR